MRFLLDTHLLLWAALDDPRLPGRVRDLLADPAAGPLFSAASIWEVAIKAALGRPDFVLDAARLRTALMDVGYAEQPVLGSAAAAVQTLPPVHGDPFDRLLVVQARSLGVPLLTVDRALAAYGSGVELV